MSLTNTLDAITLKYIVPNIQDNVYLSFPVIEKLTKNLDKSQDGGSSINQPIYYAKKTAVGHYSGYDTLSTNPTEAVTSVAFNWAHVYAGLTLAKTDKLMNSGKPQVVNAVTAETTVAKNAILDQMTSDLYSTSSVTGGIQGLALLVHTTTNFGGVSSTDITTWAGSADTSTTVLTIGAMIAKFADCTYGTRMPDLLISNQSVWAKYFQLLEVRPEFKVQNANGNLMFNGAEYLVDRNCTGSGSGTADNYLYMLTTSAIQFYQHPKNNMLMGEWREPIDQEVVINRITHSCQLGTNERRVHGKFTTINPAL